MPMPKEIVSQVLEDLLGEYILNISKENLKVGILRGKIKLDDVQLDGDLIGSHILGAVGLSGFGVLSCWAHKLRLSVSWAALEKEPTKVEIRGVHLLCVPLLPSTAMLKFGSGTATDPRCSLRTRAKRSALARFERNFFSGRIEGEGSNALDLRNDEFHDFDYSDTDINGDRESITHGISEKEGQKRTSKEPEKTSTTSRIRAWKTKMRTKIVKNIEARIVNLHIRCEIPENALHHNVNNIFRGKRKKKNNIHADHLPAYQRSFSFGFTLDSFVIKTATSRWETGNIKDSLNKSNPSKNSKKKNKSNEEGLVMDGRRFKVIEVQNMAMYWDDSVPFLISDAILSKESNSNNVIDQIQRKIVSAMDAMIQSQEPGNDIRSALGFTNISMEAAQVNRRHQYLCEAFSCILRLSFHNGQIPELSLCMVEILPCKLEFQLKPQQQLQYSRLKTAMLAQQRLDTMLHQRPSKYPSKDSNQNRAWWRYVIACVITRPNTRPWRDVMRIVSARPRYIELVIKKLFFSAQGNGFHCGLSENESVELLMLEDLLPIEALLAFHLVALRDVIAMRMAQIAQAEIDKITSSKATSKSPKRFLNRARLSRLRRSLGGKISKNKRGEDSWYEDLQDQSLPFLSPWQVSLNSSEFSRRIQVQKEESHPLQLSFKVHELSLFGTILDHTFGKPIIKVELKTNGFARLFDSSNKDLVFDVKKFEILDCLEPISNTTQTLSKILTVQPPVDGSKTQTKGEATTQIIKRSSPKQLLHNIFPIVDKIKSDKNEHDEDGQKIKRKLNNSKVLQHEGLEIVLPPDGVVCRVNVHQDHTSLSLGIAAHPAIMVWKKSCIDAISEFFSIAIPEVQTVLKGQLRNTATPLAHKAQLALLSPISISVNLIVNAPKLWVPVSAKSKDGALYLDAGLIKMKMSNKERSSETNWEINISHIQVKFNRIMTNNAFLAYPQSNEPNREIHIILPFHINIFANMAETADVNANYGPEKDSSRENEIETQAGFVNKFNVIVSRISFNFVDVDTLAKAIGRWYAMGLAKRAHYKKTMRSQSPALSDPKVIKEKEKKQSKSSLEISVDIEEIEMQLESLSTLSAGDEYENMSTASTSRHTNSDPKRTYEICIVGVKVLRNKSGYLSVSRFILEDVYVIQKKRNLTPSSTLFSVKYANIQTANKLNGIDTGHLILVRHDGYKSKLSSEHSSMDLLYLPTPEATSPSMSTNRSNEESEEKKPPILTACHLHNRMNHMDEVEIDVESFVLRVTPTTLKDCLQCLRRILGLIHLTTREMERKVHEKGRKDRNKHATLEQGETNRKFKNGSDSSILFKVTLKKTTILAGKPHVDECLQLENRNTQNNKMKNGLRNDSNNSAVVQIMSTALIMFQSDEVADGCGSKTLHISIENLSASLNSKFIPMPISEVLPILSPTAAEFRIGYTTENQGYIVSQEYNLDCDTINAHATADDIQTLTDTIRSLTKRLGPPSSNEVAVYQESKKVKKKKTKLPLKNNFNSMLHSKKKGSGIATRVRLEFQVFSFVLLRAHPFRHAGRPLFDFNLNHTKGRLEGCISAMSGECSANLSMNFFNTWISKWEYIVEPRLIVVAIEELPNELNLSIASPHIINMNLTGLLLSDLAEMEFSFLGTKRENTSEIEVASNESSRHERSHSHNIDDEKLPVTSQSMCLINESGLDILICSTRSSSCSSSYDINDNKTVHVGVDEKVFLDSILNEESQNISDLMSDSGPSLALRLTNMSEIQIGKREPLLHLPITTNSGHSINIYKLHTISPGGKEPFRQINCVSPGSVFSGASAANQHLKSMHHYEPVVEWCIQNQRLRTSTVDIYSIEKGKDLLSSQIWSPGDEFYLDLGKNLNDFSNVINGKGQSSFDSEDDIVDSVNSTRFTVTGNWLRPHLKNDAPEWTDMTYILRLARERVMLPDPNWIWVNDWTVDCSGEYGETTDGDGWEYGIDFPAFNRIRRFYKRGDNCRRRRWTRTRIVKPPALSDPCRPLSLVWETKRNLDGHCVITVSSQLSIHNETSEKLSFFAFSYSWENDQFIASIDPGKSKAVPVPLSSATYIRLARKLEAQDRSGNRSEDKLADFVLSERLMILPSGYNSTGLLRTSIRWNEVKNKTTSRTCLNFLVHIKCVQCITSIYVEPVLQVINLLPCQLECRFGEMIRGGKGRLKRRETGKKNISEKEIISLDASKVAKVLSVNPLTKPHISLRLPGYEWSPWHRIVNRGKKSGTWFPSEEEEANLFEGNEGDLDHATEFKSVVRLDRLIKGGDPLVVIVGVECGHCPILRVRAQYWIVDKTGFGLRFADEFTGFLGNIPTGDSSRRSYISPIELKHTKFLEDFSIPGHQWSVGMSGMSLYFSKREKIAFRIDTGAGDESGGKEQIKSSWSSFMDISNVMPKTVFSLEEYSGPRRFELSLNVSLCPSVFSRTKLITVVPRYQIVNLLSQAIFVAQDGCLKSHTAIPTQTSVPFHLDASSLAPSVRLSVAFDKNRSARRTFEGMWTNGCIRLDKIGITSMRVPTPKKTTNPMVIQAEVRLATPQQSSAVVIVIWSTNEGSNPLYLLRNRSSYTILCSQQCNEEETQISETPDVERSSYESLSGNEFNSVQEFDLNGGFGDTLQCQSNIFQIEESQDRKIECAALTPLIDELFMVDKKQEYVWRLPRDEVACYGFEDPEKPHILKWTCIDVKHMASDQRKKRYATLEVDGMGSSCVLTLLDGSQIICQIKAEHSTKVIEFSDVRTYSPFNNTSSRLNVVSEMEALMMEEIQHDEPNNYVDNDFISLRFRLDLLGVAISVVDNISEAVSSREILYFQSDSWFIEFSQSREGYHEIELRLMSLQVDNHVAKTAHPVLIFCPRVEKNAPFLHVSAVRRLELHSSTYVFRYVAVRMLDVDIFLDRGTAETIAQFLQPLIKVREEQDHENPHQWVSMMTLKMASKYSKPNRRAPRDIEKMPHSANSGRIYFEQLHLHPIRFSLTFTQEWMEWNPATEGLMIFQLIRGMASIAGAPLTFTSFVVNHAFEAPQAFRRIISAHYSSQLTKQIFGILGSLAILGAPADFLANVGTGVRDFFYEPINGIIHGPQQFIEGLEAGTQSLARGLVVGVTRGAANVTDAVNSNLAGLTADDDFINERAAHKRMLSDALSRGTASRTVAESLYLAGASVARGVKSGALGIVEQPTRYASRHGPGGLVQGVGKALVGAIVKPVVGLGDAAVLMMNHVSEVTSDKVLLLRIPKRLRRALPRVSVERGQKSVQLVPYDEKAAKAQKIVTAGESVDDIYIGHITTSTHLLIASEESFWAINKQSRKPLCFSWEEISHFTMLKNNVMRISIFSQVGLKPYSFQVESRRSFTALYQLLSMQVAKMGNCPSNFADLDKVIFSGELENISRHIFPGIKAKQVNHVFGSSNTIRRAISLMTKDDIEVIEKCYGRVKQLGSELPSFFKSLDEEAWTLVSSWGQVYSGLSSRRCLAVGFINGSGQDIQVKTTMLVEGGSPCYAIPSKEYDQEQGILHPGGAIIIFGWGALPSLVQAGRVFMNIETSAFICDLSDRKSRATYATALPGFEVGFLEKSYDDSGWWAKYWLLVRKAEI